jgi:CRP-like cAMP-binding protein/cytochrome P450
MSPPPIAVRAAAAAPRVHGLPLLGVGWAAARDPCRFFARCHAEYGPVFRVSYPGRTITVLAGLEANGLFATEGARIFSAGLTYARVTRELGTSMYPNAHDGARHHALRQLLGPSLSALAVEPFLPRLFAMIRECARSWTVGATTSVGRALSTLVSDVVGVCTTNRPVGRPLSRDITLWATLMGAIGVGGAFPEWLLYVRPVRAARARFAEFLKAALDEHRAHPPGLDREPDALDSLLAAAARDPDLAEPTVLLGLAMIPMKNAGIYLYRLVSFVLYELLRHASLLEAVGAELDAAFASGPPGLEELRRMPTLQGAILESLRLYPMAVALPRVVAQPFELAGFRFTAGQTVYIAGPVTHFDGALFPDPERFDPARYEPARSEHRRPHAYAPFGLGSHACLARGYSQTLAAAIVAGVLEAVRLRLEPPGYAIRVRAVPVPIPEARFKFRTVAHRDRPAAPPRAASLREGLSSVLGELTLEQREAVFADLATESFEAGSTIFRQGDRADRFFVVRRGSLQVEHEEPGRAPRVLTRLGPGDAFGEIGLLQGVPRTATVRALGRVTLLALGREAFNTLAVHGDVTRGEIVRLIERRVLVTSLAHALPALEGPALQRLAGTAQTRAVAPGEVIVRQGEPAESFYVLTRGRVEIVVAPPGGAEFVVAELAAVECFGEIGLLQRRPRTATVRAGPAPVQVLEIARERFDELLAGSTPTAEDLARVAGERLLALVRAGAVPAE